MAAIAVTWDPTNARFTIAGTSLPAGTTHVDVLRSRIGDVFSPIRGGAGITAGSSVTAHDYEFASGQAYYYRIQAFDASEVLLVTLTSAPIPGESVDTVWIKDPLRPFLNRPVTVVDFSDVTEASRTSLIAVQGRRLGVALTDVTAGRRAELVLRAADAAERRALETFLRFGDVLFLQRPPDCVVPDDGYWVVGDQTYERRGRHDSDIRHVHLPLTECAPPDPAVAGVTATYAGIAAAFASYAAVNAAFASYGDIPQFISDPSDEVIG